MKFKKIMSISLATFMLVSSLSSSFIYADNKKEYTVALNDSYYIKSPKSVTALSVSTATAILTLATHSGITFLNSDSMDEFLFRFIGLGNSKNLIEEIEKAIKSSTNGVINFSRSLLEEIQKGFNLLTPNVNVNHSVVNGQRILTAPTVHTNDEIKNIFNQLAPSDYMHLTLSDELYALKKSVTIGNRTYYWTSQRYINSAGYTKFAINMNCGSEPTISSSDCLRFYTDPTYEFKVLPVIVGNKPGLYRLRYNSNNTITVSTSICSTHSIDDTEVVDKKIETTLGEGWSSGVGTIPGNDKTTESDLDISIPNNMGSLIGLPSDSVTTPNYETWKPGTDISVPSISNPGIEYTPEEVVPDSPGDSDTENPGDTDTGSPGNWNWLKEILESILDFFRNFWETLKNLLISLFVPEEDFLNAKFDEFKGKVEEKVPNVDVGKLEELASGEKGFQDIYANILGQRVLVLKLSVIEKIINFSQPILQGVIAIYLLLYNYNQIYFLIRGTNLLGAKNTIDNYQNKRVGGRTR